MKSSNYIRFFILITFLHTAAISLALNGEKALNDFKFGISYTPNLQLDNIDGRLLLLISDDDSKEPRFQISSQPDTQLFFGIDIDQLKPGEETFITPDVFGFPIESISDIPAGEYYIQALINIYETFHRADGHVIKLPMDRGEGHQWNAAPGNLYSTPRKIYIDPSKKQIISIQLDQVIPSIPPPDDTKYIKHVKMQSKLLTEFWGRPIYLGACVLLPYGFDKHPEARYPLVINEGHFPYTFNGFRETPPDTKIQPEYSERFQMEGYNITMQKYAYQLYKDWTAANFPRMVVIEIQHANPYYDDSYAVNSANLGPYGDAITYELIPFIEEKFRCIGEGWARSLYGGSTGGWISLAAQVFYPDEYNGCYASCPDPIDFRAYMLVDIYNQKNAFYTEGKFKKVERPGRRNWLGEVSSTIRDDSYYEAVLGSNGRSGEQQDIWQAVFGPVGENGYPKPIWNKMTGEIDPSVAEYWRDNFDLRYILERDWKTLGPKLEGKIHIYCGDMDNYYLNNAVYLMENFLESTSDPYYEGEIEYGDRAEHCWNGDHKLPNAFSRLRYHQMYIPKIAEHIIKTAPEGADTTSWRY